jgi:hypothetical protein
MKEENQMKIRAILAGLIGLSLMWSWSIHPAEAATPLKKLGSNPFYKAKGLQPEAVFPLLIRMKADVKRGFIKAGAGELYEPFMEQLKTASPELVTVQPGENLKWMIYKKKGKVAVSRDLVWSGKAPFEAYRLVIQQGQRNYNFLVPKICLNITLKDVTEIPKVTAPPPAPPKEEPKASSPPKEPEATPSVAAAPPPAPASSPGPTSPEPASEKPKAEAKKGFFIGDVGVLGRFDVSAYGLLRLGYRYKFAEQLALTGLVGFAPLIDGDNEDNPAFLADAIFTYHPSKRIYLGAGVGLWSTSKDSKGDLILEVGFPISNEPKGPNFEFFIEGRSAFDQFSDWTKYGRVGGGLRILF